MSAQDGVPYDWKEDWKGQTEHARAAARALYALGVAAAEQKRRVPYAEAAAHLTAEGVGYGGVRNLLPLDALAGLCATLDVPDLSSLFWSKGSIALQGDSSPSTVIPRWDQIRDKEAEELRCGDWTSWPAPSAQ